MIYATITEAYSAQRTPVSLKGDTFKTYKALKLK